MTQANRKKQKKPRTVSPVKRTRVILVFALLIAVGFMARLFYLQVWAGAPFREAALSQRRRSVTVEPRRGGIFDRENRPLALSVTVNNCVVFPQEVAPENRTETAKLLAYILGLSPGDVEKTLASSRDSVSLKSHLTQGEVDQLNSSGIRAMRVEQQQERFYPNESLLAQTLGFVNADGQGIYGVEAQYDDLLRGVAGQMTYSRDTYGNIIPTEASEQLRSTEGQNVQLTIDLKAQQIVAEELKRGMRDFDVDAMGAIFMDPNTGEILAMESYPSFDPNTPKAPLSDIPEETWEKYTQDEQLNALYSRWSNPMVSELYEPGSVFKTVTASISIETGANKSDSRYVCEGKMEIAPDVWIHCWSEDDPHGVQTLEEALNHSCNPAFVQIVREIGKPAFFSYLQSLGISGHTGVDLPGETNALMPKSVNEMSDVQMATMSYGHGVSVTPLGMMVAANTAINGGYYVKPHVFMASTTEDGNVLSTYRSPAADPIYSQETSDTMRQYLLSTTETNDANVRRVKDVQIGSKSGTTIMLENGQYGDKTIASFYSFYPVDNPKYALLVVAKNPKTNIFGGVVSGEVSARILERLVPLQKSETRPQENAPIPDVVGLTFSEARQKLEAEGFRAIAYGDLRQESVVAEQNPKAQSVASKQSEVTLKGDAAGTYVVPDFTGQELAEAERRAEADGLSLTCEEATSGTIATQSPEAGAKVSGTTPIVVRVEE